MTSKRPKKDWYPATKIHFTEEPPSKDLEDPAEMYGYYDRRRGELWVDPKVEEHTEGAEVPQTKHGVLSHEVAHFKLKHKQMSLFPGQDREGQEEFFEPIVQLSKEMGGLVDYRLNKIREEVHELEVRLLQETGGWAQDPGDDFMSYFTNLLKWSREQAKGARSSDHIKLVRAIGRQAISNLVRQGHISKNVGSVYNGRIAAALLATN